MNSFIPNVLADRYASTKMKDIWSPEGKIIVEREFWIAVMKAQIDLGLDIPLSAIEAYERVIKEINLDSIRTREAISKHDVKARIEEFNDLAGFEHIHKGMTSRDLTENVEQLQIIRSLTLIRDKALRTLVSFAERAQEFATTPLAARTHNVVAQPTTLGRRFAMYGEELLRAVQQLNYLIPSYPFRGLKGAVGTQQDQLTLFANSEEKVSQLEQAILAHLGVQEAFEVVGQVYPRSLDFEVISTLFLVGCGPADFAQTLRLMAGHELMSEGFLDGQVGSSAMPHKMNARSAERINGLHTLLRGNVATAASLAGTQWNEGDVSCSVVRRVLLGDAFFALDAILDTTLVILDRLTVAKEVIKAELDRYAPFLASTTLLMEAVQQGMPREQAHKIIKIHAVESAAQLRSGQPNPMAAKLAEDPLFPLDQDQIGSIISSVGNLTGLSKSQIERFVSKINALSEEFPGWREFKAESIALL